MDRDILKAEADVVEKKAQRETFLKNFGAWFKLDETIAT
jgi:hypothetical protein